ncbi:MAG: DNA polymerase III subunit gamma/tau [Holosporales bacterium]|jgi:DNA polymerase-3 subunit gamma/tau|nr:DNA polymerase III subunit gamma/tau [Holosporales bacterium]
MDHYVVLSRKYRPKDLSDLVGQDLLAKSLRSCLDTKRVPHAFLFYGIRGVGKTTTARILAKCLSCIGPDGSTDITSSPCGICRSCMAMTNDQHMDIMEFDAASRTGVDDIREIVDASQYMPVSGRYKIFIIDEVHMLSKSAFNALLKTLEEPPGHVKFIFATTEVNKIPDTILSRCMKFQLNPVSGETLSNYLISVAKKEKINLEEGAADMISEESEGSVRDALSILEQARMLIDEFQAVTQDIIIDMIGGVRSNDIEKLLKLILDAQTRDALNKSEALIKNGAIPFMVFKELQNAMYKVITEKVERNSIAYPLSNLLYLWQILLKQTESMKDAFYPECVLNAAIIILSYTASFPDIDKLMLKETSSKNQLVQKVGEILGEKPILETISKNENKLIDTVLKKFPGANLTEIE